jgi:hypothetical protein
MRILLTHSIIDESVERRMDQIHRSPRLREHTIGHFFIWPEGRGNSAKLQARLSKKIRDFKPDVVIVHFGMAFLRDRDAFLQGFNSVIAKYPNVTFVGDSFAMQEKYEFKGILPTDDPKLHELVILTL